MQSNLGGQGSRHRAVRVLQDATLQLAADHTGLDQHLRVMLKCQLQSIGEVVVGPQFGDPHARTRPRRLHEGRQPEVRDIDRGQRFASADDDIVADV